MNMPNSQVECLLSQRNADSGARMPIAGSWHFVCRKTSLSWSTTPTICLCTRLGDGRLRRAGKRCLRKCALEYRPRIEKKEKQKQQSKALPYSKKRQKSNLAQKDRELCAKAVFPCRPQSESPRL